MTKTIKMNVITIMKLIIFMGVGHNDENEHILNFAKEQCKIEFAC
jgi:ribosomal protein L5